MGKVIKGSFLAISLFGFPLTTIGWEVGILGMSLGEKSYLTFGPYVILAFLSLALG